MRKEKNFSVFSKEYETLFEKNLSTFCEIIRKKNKAAFINKEYSLFFPSCGTDKKEEIEFIIYGMATNRWPVKFRVDSDKDFKSLTLKAKEYSNTMELDEDNPLDWLNNEWDKEKRKYGYDPERSFFWNVAYRLINQYYDYDIYSKDWCKKMIWSNLLKIAPAEGGNPYGALWEAQMSKDQFHVEFSVELFKKEIQEMKPKFAILLTNKDYAWEFILGLGFNENIFFENDFILADLSYNNTRIIVTKRPRFRGMYDKECVKQILELIKK